MEIRAGYKQTEVGVIPTDWEVHNLGDRCRTYSGGTPSTANSEYYGGNISWITSGDLNKSQIFSVEGRITKRGLENSSAKLISSGTLLMAMYGATAGVIAISKIEAAINQAVLAILPQYDETDFLYQFLSLSKNRIIRTFTQGGQPNLSAILISAIQIPFPPTKAEQETIAEALSDADALIESLEQLIAKKRAIKQGAMQELLRPKETWVEKCIGDLLTIVHGKSQQTVSDRNGVYPILATGGQIGTANRYLYDEPSVLIGRKGTIDRPQYMDQPFWSIDTLFYSVIHVPNNPKYMFYQFCLIDWTNHNEASGVPSLNARTIEAIKLKIPLPEEQALIASTLTDIDAEIASLEAKLHKARQLKQGMMQELLTGRIRLV